jgi:hypothetical protein
VAFMRAYARLSGDPFLASTTLVSKRKQAAAGPRMKAFRKRSVRQLRIFKSQAMGDPYAGMAQAAQMAKQNPSFAQSAATAFGNFLKGAGNIAKGALPVLAGGLTGGLPGALAAGMGQMANAKPMAGASQLGLAMPPGLSGLNLTGMGGAGGGKRRSMNVANVKALKRGIRRLEGFKGLVKRVDKLLPPGARSHQVVHRAKGRKR